MSTFPRRADHFREWSKLMLEQAVVPDRPQYKATGKSVKGMKKRFKKRRKRFLRRKRKKQE